MSQADFKLIVGADTTEARNELDAIRKSAEDVKSAREESSSASGNGDGKSSGGGDKPSQRKPAQDFGKEAGEIAGKTIGKAVAGFIAHEVAGNIFASMRHAGQDNTNIDRAESAVGGALKYGTMGAMMGGPLGALIGGLAGAGMGLWQTANKERLAREQGSVDRWRADYSRTVNGSISMSDRAFSAELETEGSWQKRIEMMKDRLGDIVYGDGSWSVKSLEKSLNKLTPGTEAYKSVSSNLETQKQRAADLQQSIFDEALPWKPKSLDASSVADSFAKRGLEIGAQADVAGVNDQMLDVLKQIRDDLHRTSGMGVDQVYSIERMLRSIGSVK